MKHFAILSIGLLFTLLTLFFEQSYWGVTGNLCPGNPNNLCYEKLPMGGFPIPYLYDNGGVSVVGKLFIEDHFYFLYFLADWIIIAILLEVAVWVVRR